MDLWYTEKQTPHHGITTQVNATLCVKKTPFQDLSVIETAQWGRMLVLDGCVMTSIADEFVYHEMIAHVPLSAHPQPKRVLVIGGGDGGAIREILRHPAVEHAVLAEIDGDVIDASRTYLPEIASGLSDPRVEICVGDGIAHVKEHPDTYDVILVDSTDPVGPAVGLFSREFYADIHRALRPDGLFVAQSESPFFNGDLIARMQADVRALFPIAGLYLA
ncbi:MAG: polyamine aminopropyltransferase, partial [Firmicutes bacterium]|nr:polyamine aminopropyltransferase [Bacillota bacterium]